MIADFKHPSSHRDWDDTMIAVAMLENEGMHKLQMHNEAKYARLLEDWSRFCWSSYQNSSRSFHSRIRFHPPARDYSYEIELGRPSKINLGQHRICFLLWIALEGAWVWTKYDDTDPHQRDLVPLVDRINKRPDKKPTLHSRFETWLLSTSTMRVQLRWDRSLISSPSICTGNWLRSMIVMRMSLMNSTPFRACTFL